MRIAIAGGSGFVGQKLISCLIKQTDSEIISLSRRSVDRGKYKNSDRLTYRLVDLHNLKSIEAALENIDVAIYLVHSMLPTARLNQGHFRDFDLSLADNFGRAARLRGVKQIIYLSGLMPAAVNISPHLMSRREVEEVLSFYVSNTTILRAGLILGPGGSSFTIMLRLVERLPIMLCPAWAQNKCHPSLLDDVVDGIIFCLMRENTFGKVYDLGSGDAITYSNLLKICSDYLRKRRIIISVPFLNSLISRFWLQFITRAPKRLVYPLVESLKDSMLVRDDHRLNISQSGVLGAEEMIARVLKSEEINGAFSSLTPYAFERRYHSTNQSTVRSIQRLPLPAGKDAYWVARQYIKWTNGLLPFLLNVRSHEDTILFKIFGFTVLVLEHSPDRSQPDRQLFYVREGLLVKVPQPLTARLEMRETMGGRGIIAAIHDFEPSLPWPIYRLTQALAHRYVMWRFGLYLSKH